MIGSEVKGNLLPHSFLFITLALSPQPPHFFTLTFSPFLSHSSFFSLFFFYTRSFFLFFFFTCVLLNPSDYVLPFQGSCGVPKDLILMQQGTKIPEPEWFSQVKGITLPRAVCSRWTAVTYHLTLTNTNV